jgi:hypothetical protein
MMGCSPAKLVQLVQLVQPGKCELGLRFDGNG